MNTSTLLRKAKTFLWAGKSKLDWQSRQTTYVTAAVDMAMAMSDSGCKITRDLERMLETHEQAVRRRVYANFPNIKISSNAEDWLVTQGVPRADVQDPVKMQAWRHEWLDRLAQEYESRGD